MGRTLFVGTKQRLKVDARMEVFIGILIFFPELNSHVDVRRLGEANLSCLLAVSSLKLASRGPSELTIESSVRESHARIARQQSLPFSGKLVSKECSKH